MNVSKLISAGLFSLFWAAGAAGAADAVIPGADAVEYTTPSGWTFNVALYGWLAGLEGDVGVRGRTAHVDASFSDVLEDLDIGVMGFAEARYERFGVFTDLNYVKLSTSSDTPFGVLASSADFTTHSLMWTAAGEYRLLDQPDASLDAFAGFRLFSIENELNFNPPGLLGGLDLSQTETWADPIVGLKGNVALSPQFYLTSWAMIGGGASSDIVWDLMGGGGYWFTESFSVFLGYRAAGVDYENDGFVYDVVQHGPILGAVFRF